MEEEKNEPESEVYDFNRPNYEFVPKGSHQWRQMGYYIICKSCEMEHAFWIGSEKQLIGIKEDGIPILKKIDY